jgi:hypothetical protein
VLPIVVAVGALGMGASVVAAQRGATAANTAEIAERCRGPEHRQFDFWLGAWEVRDSAGALLGQNDITRVSAGCALHEDWRGAGGGVGISVNTYDAALGKWTQRWVGAGATLWLEGGLEDGAMVLAGTAPRTTPRGPVLDRITWTPLPDGRVRQTWDISTDQGQTWMPSFVGFYSRRPVGAAAIDTLVLEGHARFLADDLLEGRGTASRGERLAALYLEAQVQRLGLQPLPSASDFRLPVPLTGVHVRSEDAALRLAGQGGARTLRPPDFYHPGGSGAAFRDFGGDLLLAGSASGALAALEDHMELSGRVVVLTPPWDGVDAVTAELLRRGAEGAIHLIPDGAFYERLRIVRGPTRYFLPDGVRDPANQSRLPQVIGGPELIGALALETEVDPGVVVGRARALPRNIMIDLPHVLNRRTGYNVAAHIRGADPTLRDEWLVFVAHYDHVGFGESENGDSIWNGFIDNAVGSAMLLEIARVMAADPPDRSVAFLWVTAEEQGLLGSNWFVHDAPLPLDRVVAAINLDGGAPPAPPVRWGLVGADDSAVGAAAAAVIESHGWGVDPVAIGPQSDHWPFHLAGVPVVMLFPGSALEGLSAAQADALRDRWLHPHTPRDAWSPDFPFTGLERYAALALDIGLTLANGPLRR